MRRTKLLLIPALFMMTSCTISSSNEDKECTEHIDNDFNGFCDICGADLTEGDGDIEEEIHATSVGGDPSAPFYLKVGETRTLTAKLSPTPTRSEEKEFTWTNGNKSLATMTVDPSDSKKATVTGFKPGKATFTAKNTYDKSLSREFVANVIDFDEDNSYLWQFDSKDKEQFGSTSDNAKGNKEGVAFLGNLSWSYSRSAAISLRSLYGAMQLGKGKEPERVIHLENANTRTVKQIIIETGSANGLAQCTVKVGDQVVIDKPAPAPKNDVIDSISTEDNLNLTGNISIHFESPEYDPVAEASDENYRAPGAVYIKSIYIKYAEEFEPVYVTQSKIDFESIFANSEHSFWNGITSTAKEKDYTQDGISYHFEKIKKVTSGDSEVAKQYFNTNGAISICAPIGQVISRVELKIKMFNSKNVYSASGSIVGGEPYTITLGTGSTEGISLKIYNELINAIKLINGSTSNVGLVSLTVKTVAGLHASLASVSFPNGAVPAKTTYNVGEEFDPTGLGNATAIFTDDEIPSLEIAPEYFKWYDGASYDAKPSTATNIMTASSTYVYGVYNGFVVKISGINVTDLKTTYRLVTSLQDIGEGGSFLFACKQSKTYWKGSSSTGTILKGSDGVGNFTNSISDEFEASVSINKERITITKEASGKYTIKAGSINVGMTDTGSISVASSLNNKYFYEWSLTIAEGIVKFEITDNKDEPVYKNYLSYLSASNKFGFSTTEVSNISLYKLIEQ